jgi:hypothetical protein
MSCMKRLLASAALILAGGGMTIVTAFPASAASQQLQPAVVGIAAHGIHAGEVAAAAGILTIHEIGGVVIVACTPQTNYDLTGSETMLTADNGCQDRVWLHQFVNYGNNHGWAYCISAGANVAVPSQFSNPRNIFISANTAPCA